MTVSPNEIKHDELAGFIRSMCHIVGLQEEDILEPTNGAIVLGQTGVSILWSSKPNPCWQIREKYDVINTSGERYGVSRLIASVPEEETIRASKVALILVFERSLDIEISML